MNLIDYLYTQRAWSVQTFGPGDRTVGLIRHILSELHEIIDAPTNEDKFVEFIDVMILAFDGAMRLGATPEQVAAALQHKQRVNTLREWPDWRTAQPGQPIEHIREATPANSGESEPSAHSPTPAPQEDHD